MTRSIWIPAIGCLAAFAALWATLQGATRRSTVDVLRSASAPSEATRGSLSIDEAEQVLSALSSEYLRPWRALETSPHRLYSRAAPRPIPPSYANVELAAASAQSEAFLVATLSISKAGGPAQQVPCVVDRSTRQVRLFAAGQWQDESEWLANAPLP
jgi:hypothetical protein